MTLLPFALDALKRGFWIFPCNAAGALDPDGNNIEKVAHLTSDAIAKGKPWKLRWSEVATNDINQVVRWWTADPQSNIGIACKQSNLLVVDCDVKGWGQEDGIDQYIKIADTHLGRMNSYKAFESYSVRTGSGGEHIYWRWPPDVQASQAGLSKLVDIRSNGGEKGGYVLGAGSRTTKGEYTVSFDMPVAPVPGWLRARCTEQPKPAQPRDPFVQPRGTGNYSGLVDSVLYAPEGNRNNALLWAARTMCEEGASLEEAMNTLGPASSLPGKEKSDTIKSAYRLQERKT